MSTLHVATCPTCNGQRIVSRPPWVAGDVPTWMSSTTGTFPCPTCEAKGWIKVTP